MTNKRIRVPATSEWMAGRMAPRPWQSRHRESKARWGSLGPGFRRG